MVKRRGLGWFYRGGKIFVGVWGWLGFMLVGKDIEGRVNIVYKEKGKFVVFLLLENILVFWVLLRKINIFFCVFLDILELKYWIRYIWFFIILVVFVFLKI